MVCTSTSGRLALKQGETKYKDLLLIAPLLNHVKTEPLSVSQSLGRRAIRQIEMQGINTCLTVAL